MIKTLALPWLRLWQHFIGAYPNMNFHSLGGKLAYVKKYYAWQWNAYFGLLSGSGCNETCTIILLSHSRIENMQPIVRSALKCDFLEKIIVCNTNPSFDIRRSIRFRDPRIELMNTDKPHGSIMRYQIAAKRKGHYFISIDDDVFLYPDQIYRLFRRLVAHPEIPHGIWGQIYEGDLAGEPVFTWNVFGRDISVDILNRVHAFTDAHVASYFRVLSDAGIDESSEWWNKSICDIPLAFSTFLRPACHDIGFILQCPTESSPTIAQWAGSSFQSDRNILFRRIAERIPIDRPRRGFYYDGLKKAHLGQWNLLLRFVNKGIRFRFIRPWMRLPFEVRRAIQWDHPSFRMRNVRIHRDYRVHAESVANVQSVSSLSSYALGLVVQAGVWFMPSDQAFVQVGTWEGYLFFSGAAGNAGKTMIGVDNFSSCGNARDRFLANFEKFKMDGMRFVESESLDFLRKYDGPKIGFFVYDGDHDYQVQYDHLAAAIPHLAPGAMILIDDTNWGYTRQGVTDFLRDNPRLFRLVAERRTVQNMHPTWWNGFMLLQYTP